MNVKMIKKKDAIIKQLSEKRKINYIYFFVILNSQFLATKYIYHLNKVNLICAMLVNELKPIWLLFIHLFGKSHVNDLM